MSKELITELRDAAFGGHKHSLLMLRAADALEDAERGNIQKVKEARELASLAQRETLNLAKEVFASRAAIAQTWDALEYSKKVQEFAKSVQTGSQDRELARMEKVLWEKTLAAIDLPASLDALHELRALECERLRKVKIYDAHIVQWLDLEIDVHRAKKGSVL